MKKLIVVLIVLLLAPAALANWEGKVTFGDELNIHLGVRPFPSKHFSVGLATTGVRETSTTVRQVGIDDWSVGGYLEMSLLDLSTVWPQLLLVGEGHAGFELMHTLEKDGDRNALLQAIPYVGLCVGLPDLPDVFAVTDTRYYEDRDEVVVSLGLLFLIKH